MATLQTVKAGDEVVWSNGVAQWPNIKYNKVTVTDATSTRLTTEDGKVWNRRTGEEWGSKSLRRARLSMAPGEWGILATWEQASAAEVEQAEQKNRKRLIREVGEVFERLTVSYATMDEIARILVKELGEKEYTADDMTERGWSFLATYMK